MLSTHAAAVVRSTIPVVATNRKRITQQFYEAMAATHPLVLPAFDQFLPDNGDQRKALMSAVLDFARSQVDPAAAPGATNLSNLTGSTISVVSHVGSTLTPDQILIAGRVLSSAFTRALGNLATPDIVRQWDEVFWLFATTSIAGDAMRYQHHVPYDSVTWHRWSVVGRDEEATDTASFTLEPADGEIPPTFVPGQYAPVGVTLADGSRQLRHYTLNRGRKSNAIRITVRRLRGERGAPDGVVSSFLHDKIDRGDVLDVGPFVGDVTLDPGTAPLVLVSAGIGITYTAALLDHVARNQPSRPVISVHADRSPGCHALMRMFAAQASLLESFAQFTWYALADTGAAGVGTHKLETSSPDADASELDGAHWGRVRISEVAIPRSAQVYLCGPLGFMHEIRTDLIRLGHNPARIYYEVFGPDLWAVDTARADGRQTQEPAKA